MHKSKENQNSNTKKKKILGGLALGAIPILFILYLVLGPLFHVLSKDLSAKEMYVISEWVNVRSSADIKGLKMGKVDYGTKLLVYEIIDDWAEVLIEGEGQKGYVAEKFIADPETFYLLDGLFGDKKAAKTVVGAKNRLALIRYLKSKEYITDLPKEIQKELYGDDDREVYQLFKEPFGSRYNSVLFADFDGDFRQDAAFVLKNKDAGISRLVIISFDKHDPMNISNTIFDEKLDEPWFFIKLAKKGHRYYTDEEKKVKIPINGILIGSNRNRKLEDPTTLLLYDGENFNAFLQSEK